MGGLAGTLPAASPQRSGRLAARADSAEAGRGQPGDPGLLGGCGKVICNGNGLRCP